VEPQPAGATAGATAGRPRGPRRPGGGSPVTVAAIAAGALLVALLLLLNAVTVANGPSPKPSPTASPAASPSPTPSPSPSAAPLTFSEAVEAFKDLVDRGEEDGLIENDAAEELRDRVDDVAHEVEDGSPGQVNRAIRNLREAIDGFERDGPIGSTDLADRLRQAVSDIDAAAAGER
ncbi:MAG: FIMAH domain-containing protein, partial [Candidatus Limnocylindria bacterium]